MCVWCGGLILCGSGRVWSLAGDIRERRWHWQFHINPRFQVPAITSNRADYCNICSALSLSLSALLSPPLSPPKASPDSIWWSEGTGVQPGMRCKPTCQRCFPSVQPLSQHLPQTRQQNHQDRGRYGRGQPPGGSGGQAQFHLRDYNQSFNYVTTLHIISCALDPPRLLPSFEIFFSIERWGLLVWQHYRGDW